MKRRIIIVNTYFQLIAAIQLANTIFKNDITDIILSDASSGMKEKINKIIDASIFNKVYYIETKKFDDMNKIRKYLKYLFSRNSILNNSFKCYDEVIFNNLNVLTYSVIDENYKKNKKMCCAIIDEGFSTYTIKRKNNKFNNVLRTILLRNNIEKNIKKNVFIPSRITMF